METEFKIDKKRFVTPNLLILLVIMGISFFCGTMFGEIRYRNNLEHEINTPNEILTETKHENK